MIIYWIIYPWFFWPFHYSFILYNIINYITESGICKISPGTKPYIFINLLIWILVVWVIFYFFINMKYKFKLAKISNHTFNYCIASLSNKILLLPTLIFSFYSYLFKNYQCNLEKSKTFIFIILYITVFSIFNSNIA